MMNAHPLVEEIKYIDPTYFFKHINNTNAIWLDSAQSSESLGRYSYIGVEPLKCLTLKNGLLNGKPLQDSPQSIIKQELAQCQLESIGGIPPFQGGLAGFISYDYGWYLEDLPNEAQDDMGYEDWLLGVYDLVLSFDHLTKRSWIISTGAPLQGQDRLAKAKDRLKYAKALVNRPKFESVDKPWVVGRLTSTHDKKSYENMVSNTIEAILAGDIFEANVSQRFKTSFNGCATSLYHHLRQVNPAPFAAMLNFEKTQILSASPERFVQVSQAQVETRPIKGTMARGVDRAEDISLGEQLLASEKDRAENIMIVDLMRNDLSKVCKPFSVKVPQLCELESYAVHHLVSSVVGELKDDKDAVDLLEACFPGGSITGAPKLRAMEIIESLEPYKRGPYCGAIGFMSYTGDMDLNIAIRTMSIKNNHLTFGAGGAVTAESNPASEYEESLAKAHTLIGALSG